MISLRVYDGSKRRWSRSVFRYGGEAGQLELLGILVSSYMEIKVRGFGFLSGGRNLGYVWILTVWRQSVESQ
jgi:hypothetical protein